MGGVRPGWLQRSLGELCSIARGGSPRPIQAFLTDAEDGINWVKISDATASGKYIYTTAEKIKPAGASRSRIVKDGDLLLSNSMSFGRPYIMRTTGCIHDGWLVLSEYDTSFNQDFLYHLLGSPQVFDQFDRLAAGSTVRNLNIDLASRVMLPVPPIGEQRRIVAILDEAFEAIATAKANTEKNLQNAREVFTSRRERVFSEQGANWRRVPLDCIGATQTGSTPKSSEPENLGHHLPFVKPGDFNRDGSITFDNEGLSEIGAQKARRVQANSALMVCIGATIGKTGFSEREIATNQQVNAWTATTSNSAKFIYYQMTCSDFQLRVRQGAGQATLPIINKSKWSALTVATPPTLDAQLKIVAELDAFLAESMNLEAVYEGKLAALDELKKSLLHQAFAGALTAKTTDQQVAELA